MEELLDRERREAERLRPYHQRGAIQPANNQEYTYRHDNIPSRDRNLRGQSSEAERLENTTAEADLEGITVTRDLIPAEHSEPRGRLQPFYVGTDPYNEQRMSVLERQYMVGTFTWSGSDVVGTQLGTMNFPYKLLTVATNLEDKMKRFEWFRADTEIELRLNGTMFHYGKIIGGWLPHCNEAINAKWGNIYVLSTSNGFTMSPGTNVPVKFTIPYVGPRPYWSVDDSDNKGYFGSFWLEVLNPLSLSGSASTPSLTITVFARFVNPELAGPTLHDNIGAQSGRKAKLPDKEAEEKSETGLVSAGLGAAGTLATVVSKIPFVPPEVGIGAGILGKGLKLAGGFAKSLGLDKPDSLQTTQPVGFFSVNGMSNGRGLDVSTEMGLEPGNRVSNDCKNFGVFEDQMDIVYLAKKPGLVETWSFTASSVAGEVIKKYWVTPATCATYLYTAVQYTQFHTPASAVAYLFRYWRGSIKFRVEIVCSKYVTGRLRIAWHPSRSEIPANYTTGAGDFHSAIIDFTGDTSYNFTIPYLSNTLWSECEDSFGKTLYGSNGAIAFSIVNPVVVATSVGATTVYVNVYQAGGDDIEFSLPTQRVAPMSVDGQKYRRVVTGANIGAGTYVAQGESESNFLEEIFKKPFPTIVPAKGTHFDNVNMGEKIGNLKTLLHRFEQYENAVLNAGTWTTIADQVTEHEYDTTLNYLKHWFLFYRGSIRMKLVKSSINVNDEGALYVQQVNINDTVYEPISNYTRNFGRNGFTVEDTTVTGVMQLRLPYVNKHAFITNPPYISPLVSLRATPELGLQAYWTPRGAGYTNNAYYQVFISVGDDFSMGWPCGTPITQYTLTAPTGPNGIRDGKTSGGDQPEERK